MALTQPRPSKEEDITAVLGRFKAWNTGLDAQVEAESKKFTGLEEISYEEALGDLGRRRVLPRTSPERQVDLSSAMKVARDTLSLSTAGQLQSTQAKTSSVPAPAAHLAESISENKSAAPSAAPLAATAIPSHIGAARLPEEPVTKQAGAATPKRAASVRTSTVKSGKINATLVAASPKSLPQKRASRSKAPATSKAAGSTVNAQLASSSRPQQTFKAVLEDRLAADRKQGTARIADRAAGKNAPGSTTRSAMVPWVQSQAISLKLRISAGEHAAIKAGASEAGLPLAAYMRQCTLDVEVLRKLLKQTIADIRTFEPSAAQPLLAAPAPTNVPAAPSRPGLLKRLKNAWFDRGPEIAS